MAKKRAFRAPLIGDPGIIPEHVTSKINIPNDDELALLSLSELASLALKIGISAADLYSIKTCSEHTGFIQVQRSPNAKYTLGLDVVYCLSCYVWWREKKPLEQ